MAIKSWVVAESGETSTPTKKPSSGSAVGEITLNSSVVKNSSGKYTFRTPSRWSQASLPVPQIELVVTDKGRTADEHAVIQFDIALVCDESYKLYTGKTITSKPSDPTPKLEKFSEYVEYAYVSVTSNNRDIEYVLNGQDFKITGEDDDALDSFISDGTRYTRLLIKPGRTILHSFPKEVKLKKEAQSLSFTLNVTFGKFREGLTVQSNKGGWKSSTSRKGQAYTITSQVFSLPPAKGEVQDDPGNDPNPSTPPTSTDTTETPLFEADWSEAVIFNLDDNSATSKPSTPSVSIDGTTLNITFKKSEGLESEHDVKVVFEVVQDDRTTIIRGDDIAVFTYNTPTNELFTSAQVELGHSYKVRCQAQKITDDKTFESEWSDWSESVQAAPVAPGEIIVCRSSSSNGSVVDQIYLEWLASDTPEQTNTAESYNIEYIALDSDPNLSDEDLFENSNYEKKSVNTENESTKFLLTGLPKEGKVYFIRIQAVGKNNTLSDWSPVKIFILGQKPAAPTTWSSSSVIAKGEPVTLYWVHNSMDESSETSAIVSVWVHKTIKFIPSMEVTVGSYYTIGGDKYKCVKSGNPVSLDEEEFFELAADNAGLVPHKEEKVYRTVVFMGTEENPMQVYSGRYYTNGVDKYLCRKDGFATTLEDSYYFEKVSGGYDEDEVGFYVLETTDPIFTDGATIKWEVRTAGISGDHGPASIAREISVYEQPTMALSVTDYTGELFDTLTSFPINIKALTGPKTQAPIGYYLSIKVTKNGQGSHIVSDAVGNPKTIHEDEIVYYEYFDTTRVLETSLSAGDVSLANNVNYTLSVIASMNTGLTVENSVKFTVGWSTEQYLPTASIMLNNGIYAAAICPYCDEKVTRWHRVRKTDGSESTVYLMENTLAPESVSASPLVISTKALGKNRLDMNMIIDQHNCSVFVDTDGLHIGKTDDIAYITLTPMYLTAGFDYVLSFTTTSRTSRFYWMTDAGEVVSNTKRFTPSENGYYSITFYNDGDIDSTITINNAQVELGTKATDYEEFQGVEILQEQTPEGQEVYYTVCNGIYSCTQDGPAESLDEGAYFTKVIADKWNPDLLCQANKYYTNGVDTYRCTADGTHASITDTSCFDKITAVQFMARMDVVNGSYYTDGYDMYLCAADGSVESIDDPERFTKIEPSVWIEGTYVFAGTYYTNGADVYLCLTEGEADKLDDPEYFAKLHTEPFKVKMDVTKGTYYTPGSDDLYYYYCPVEEYALTKDVLLSVYRRNYDGTFTEISKNKENKRIFVPDPHPALDYARYRIVAMSKATGAVSYYDLPSRKVGCKSVIIQWDEDWNDYHSEKGPTTQKTWTGSFLSLPYNIDVTDKRSVEVEMVKYVGRKHPVSYYGTHLGETASWSCAIPKTDKETLYALRRLAAWAGDVYVREPSGVGYWANIVVNFSQKHLDMVIPVSFEITRVEGGM